MKPFFRLIFLLLVKLTLSDAVENYNDNNAAENELACPYDRVCVPVGYCPGVESMMIRKALPAQRFRLAVCGYEATVPKVCCSPSQDASPRDTRLRSVYGRSESRFDCGRSFLPINTDSVTLGSFPFLARIGFVSLITGEMKYPCVGTIINSRTVLTTATCALAQSKNYKLQSVLVGEYDTSTNPDCNYLFCGHNPPCQKISYVVKHPGFDSQTFANNIALIRLQEPINFTVTAQPACVYTGREFNLSEMEQVRLFGWGKLSNEINPSNELRALYVRLLPRQDCTDFVNKGLCVELCAIGENEPCAGFSGGPIIRMNGNRYTIEWHVAKFNMHSVGKVGLVKQTVHMLLRTYEPYNPNQKEFRLGYCRTVRPARIIGIRPWHSSIFKDTPIGLAKIEIN